LQRKNNIFQASEKRTFVELLRQEAVLGVVGVVGELEPRRRRPRRLTGTGLVLAAAIGSQQLHPELGWRDNPHLHPGSIHTRTKDFNTRKEGWVEIFGFQRKITTYATTGYCSSTALPILYVVKRAVTEALEGILLIRENQGKL
jgi:hypothetical protein